ncbi:MAG: glycosyltransferase, partial [Candidatus Nitrosocaldaceae archaeon]
IRVSNTSFPIVTVQLPLFNERYVAERLIKAVCNMDYPKDKLHIQVLDDSTDDTIHICEELVGYYRSRGFDIEHIRREDRTGYKAGALREGLKSAKGDFIAIFDADFVPPPWFLKKALEAFDDNVGFVQCRWGHLNEDYSALTEAQALSLDLHFLIEQKAKSLTHIFMNFNGTAGVWRKECIYDAGGWQINTLVEDLDLSYRAQIKGWKSVFVEDAVIPAELPVQINSVKRQQYRWAKGSIQCAVKLLQDVIMHKHLPADTKIQAFVQLTRHIVYPLLLIQFLLLPLLLAIDYNIYPVNIYPLSALVMFILFSFTFPLIVIKKVFSNSWKKKIRAYIYLILFGSGIAVNNTIAVLDALYGGKPEFLRTPKFGITKKGEEWRNNIYALPFTKTTLLEIFFAAYGILGIFISIFSNNQIYAPIIAIQTAGFIYVSYLSIAHSIFKNRHNNEMLSNNVRRVNMKSKLALVAILSILLFGVVMAWVGYSTSVYPLDKARGYLTVAMQTSNAEEILDYLASVKTLLPASGNPVWMFPTPKSDFGIMQKNLDNMMNKARSLSQLQKDSVEFNTGLSDLRGQLTLLEDSIEEAQPYVYASFQNIVFSIIWIAVIMMIFSILKRSSNKIKEYEKYNQT